MRLRRLACLVALCLVTQGTVARAQSAREDATEAQSAGTSTTSPSRTEAVERQREIEEQIRNLRNAIGEASAEEVRLIRALSKTQDDLDEHDATVARIESELAGASARLAVAEEEVERLDGRYIALSRRLQETNRRITALQDDLAATAAALYRRVGTSDAALTSLALDAQTPQDLFAGSRYLSDTASADFADARRLTRLQDEVESRRAELEGEREAAKAARDVVAAEQSRIVSLKREQEQARSRVAGLVAAQERVLAEIRTKKSHFANEIQTLQAESNSIAGMLRDLQSGQTFVPSGSGVLGVPVSGALSSGFGPRHHPILGTSRMHNGVDFAAPSGTPIRAAGDGVVVWAGPRGGYGNTVVIDHGNTLATLYAHQSSVAVGTGQSVTRGQTIGAVGSTGLSTGPHLHFEARVRGTPVNPLQYL